MIRYYCISLAILACIPLGLVYLWVLYTFGLYTFGFVYLWVIYRRVPRTELYVTGLPCKVCMQHGALRQGVVQRWCGATL